MKRAVLLLCVVAMALAAPPSEQDVAGSTAIYGLPPPPPPPPPPAHTPEPLPPVSALPPTEAVERLRRDAEEEGDRAAFFALLEELEAIARNDRSENGYNFNAIFAVLRNPESDRPFLLAKREPF